MTLQISADPDSLHFNIGKTYSPHLKAIKMQLVGQMVISVGGY